MKTILTELLNLLFPKLCVVCRSVLIQGEKHICTECSKDLPYTFFDSSDNPVSRIFTCITDPPVTGTALLYYEKESAAQKIIHDFKYRGNRSLAYYMGRLAASGIKPFFDFGNADLIMPVPLHPRRKKERGYNQAEWISRGMSDIWNIPVDISTLKRQIKTQTQTLKNVSERKNNMKGAFILINPEYLEGKHIILVDDVITSGSTLLSCVEILAPIPNIKISVLALAMTNLS